MKRVGVFILVVLVGLLCVGSASAGLLTPEEGQDIFDSVFWLVMEVFVLGLTAGLAIKMINRS